MKSTHLNKLIGATLLATVTLTSLNANAQTLGEFKTKDQSGGLGKTRSATRVYISNFTVNYQIYNEKTKFKQGGAMFGGGYKGDAKAEASVGLNGLTEKDVQDVTDKLYGDFVTAITAGGLTLINADEAAKTSTYSDFVRLSGGKLSLAQLPGTLTTQPAGFDFFVKSVNKDGKTNAGGFFGNDIGQHASLSKQLNDAIIADVELFVLFVEDQNAFQGDGANVKIKTNLRLADQEAIVMAKTSGFRLKGQNTVTYVNSAVKFTYGKMGLGPTASYVGMLSKPLEINDVIEDVKVQSFARGKGDAFGNKTVYGTFFMTEDRSNESTKVVDVDSKKYATGVYEAGKKFINFHVSAFLDKRK